MRWRGPVLTVLMCGAAAGCGGADSSDRPTSPSPSATVRLVGRVVDERTLQGLAGVTLSWGGGAAGLLHISSVTDATGAYEVQLPDAEYYSVSADRAFPMSIVRPTGSLDIVNFYVNTGGCPTEYGRIIDARTRRTIAGAQVSWVGVTSTSDATGNFRLTLECRPGAYGTGPTTVSVSHPGYEPYTTAARNAETLGTGAADVRHDIALTPR